jgi:hypothetical protein
MKLFVFSTIWAYVRVCWFLSVRGVLLLDHIWAKEEPCGRLQTSSLGGTFATSFAQRGNRSYGGGILNLKIAR